jgi:hypothetical protein
MTLYVIRYDRDTRYQVIVDADGPEEAIERFWEHEHAGDNAEEERETATSGPTGLSMTDSHGRYVTWGQPTTL